MHTVRRPALRFWLIRLLVGLLVLAPYLHGHVGASTQAGLHLAGMHTLAPAAALNGELGQAEESLAIGVSPSLPLAGIDLLGLVACALVLSLCLRQRTAPGLPRPARHTAANTVYRLGWPPPSLAPPRA